MSENERKYDRDDTIMYSVDDILSELNVKNPALQKKAQVTQNTDVGHELWIGLESEAPVGKFNTNEYEPEEFSGLKKEENTEKTAVIEVPEKKEDILDVISEYDAEDEKEDLFELCKNEKKAHLLRLIFGGLTAAFLAFLAIGKYNNLSIIAFLNSFNWLFPAVAGGLMLITVLIYILPMIYGIKSIFCGKPTGDSGIMLSAAISLILPVIAVIYPQQDNVIAVFTLSAAIGLIFTSIGGLLRVGSRSRAIALAKSEGEKRVLIPIENENTCKDLLRGMKTLGNVVYEPVRTKEISELEDSVSSQGITDMSLRVMTLIALLGGIAIGVLDYFLFGKSVPTALLAFVLFVMTSTALTAPLISALPFFRMSRHLSRFGSAVCGNDAVNEMTQIGSVVVDSNYLFTKNSVVLHGIRTFGSFRIDDAIIDAASVVCASNGALSSVFLSVIDNDRSLLRKVDTIVYEDGLGLSAWVSERRVLIGTAELLKNHGIAVPSRDYENKYLEKGRNLVYVSVAGQLTAMFVVSYRVRRDVFEKIRSLYRHRIGLIIVNRDCNITEEKIAKHFKYPQNMIKILPPSSEYILGNPTYSKCPAKIIYSKGIMGLVEAVVSSLRMNTTVNITNILQLGGSILGCALISYLTAIGGLSFFGISELLLWQGAWAVITLLVSLFRRP